MFRFIHAADLHLDTPFQGLQRTNAELATRLRDASLEALDALVDIAIEQQVDFIVLAGDVYDGAERGRRAQLRLRDATRRLSDKGIRTFIVHGNHDPLKEGWTAVGKWPELVTIFGSEAVETCAFSATDGSSVSVSGISYPRSDVSENLALQFPVPAGESVNIAVLHTNVGSNGEHAPYSPCTLQDLQTLGYDYWALGHIHKREVLASKPVHVVYPGNIQGRSFKSSEQGAKGAYRYPK